MWGCLHEGCGVRLSHADVANIREHEMPEQPRGEPSAAPAHDASAAAQPAPAVRGENHRSYMPALVAGTVFAVGVVAVAGCIIWRLRQKKQAAKGKRAA